MRTITPGMSAVRGVSRSYSIEVPAGRTLQVRIAGGQGDADLYVQRGTRPTTTQWLCRPHLPHNEERCSIHSPETALYFIRVYAYRSFFGVRLNVSY
ncbi:hypothetical protein ARC20_15395 [Stenotrophomonas panacihumi]|uniref:Peptidase C-terminal archaeal/bacterial domain-containing protein n=3 Tax=Stenotrophomonas panacihumi TaxID=676599 RepID=A0A0Q9ZZ08_9GAMM|nr:PPC domain-containing protein [Stenotrophomonas panacihumi]KRG38159.1 hypothetical protein ARC20_15395 [Stenotrophomonas panacihumi]